jgi:hypothetical protein
MKKAAIVLSMMLVILNAPAQNQKDSIDLLNRLEIFYKSNESLDYEKMLDFMYPKIFTLSSREETKASIENTFNNEELSMKMDSLKTIEIFPFFSVDSGRYVRITYSMILIMSYKKSSDDSSQMKNLLEIMQGQFGKENARLNETGKSLMLLQKVDMAAIKDNLSPEWTFLNLTKDDPMLEMILSKEIISRFYPN